MIHKMKLSEPWYTLIKKGKKTIELRLLDEKRSMIKKNDTIIFSDVNTTKSFKKKVKKLTYHKTFENALKYGKLKNIVPGVRTYNEAIKIYYDIPGYKSKENDKGVVLIYL